MEPTTERHKQAGSEYLGFEIRSKEGWYVAVPKSSSVWRVFEARSIRVLRHKIQRWQSQV